MIAMPGVLIDGIPRGAGFQGTVVRERSPGDHQPFLGSHAFALQASLHAPCGHLDLHWTFLPVSYRHMGPRIGREALPPIRHRLPRSFRPSSTPVVRGQRDLQVANGGGAGHPQHIALTPLAQLVAEPRVATQFIVPCDPAMGHLITLRIEHLHTLLLPRVIAHRCGHVAFLASSLVACPLLGQGQAKVEQGMVLAGDLPHENAHLAGVDLAPVATPLALHAHRMRPPLGKAARIKGDDAIGFAQPFGHFSDQHRDQRAMIPRCRPDEVLQDLSIDIDQGGDLLSILAVHVGQQPLEVEVNMTPTDLGLQSALVRHDKIAQVVHHGVEYVGGHDTIAQ
jgi:hypothetical protein